MIPRLEGYAAGRVLDVFQSERGEYLGRVDLPVALTSGLPAVAVPGHIHAVVPDDLGVHYVVVDLATPSGGR